VLATASGSFDDFAVVARREAEARARFPVGDAVLVAVPQLAGDVHEMGGLLELGRVLLGH